MTPGNFFQTVDRVTKRRPDFFLFLFLSAVLRVLRLSVRVGHARTRAHRRAESSGLFVLTGFEIMLSAK